MAVYYSKYGYSIVGNDPAIMLKQFSERARSTYNVRKQSFGSKQEVGEWVAGEEWEYETDEAKRLKALWRFE